MKLVKILVYYLKFNELIVFGEYPCSEREMDGFLKRVKAVDDLLIDYQRIYINIYELPAADTWYSIYDSNLLVLSVKHNQIARACAFLLILKAKILYFHSVYPLRRISFLMYLPCKYKILDMHGVVPEEEYHKGNLFEEKIYNRIEKNAVKKSDCIIVVSNAMRKHIISKYKEATRKKFILLPIIPVINEELVLHASKENKPAVVYAGGLQKWQQITKMLQIIHETEAYFNFYIFCPEPGHLYEIIKKLKINLASVTIDTLTHDELPEYYRKCRYGFILREDNLINKVACPTKLVEYLAFGVIPIMEFDGIGDFLFYGVQYIHYEVFLQGRLPDEKEQVEMIKNNYKIYKRLMLEYLNGAKHMQSIFNNTISCRKNHS